MKQNILVTVMFFILWFFINANKVKFSGQESLALLAVLYLGHYLAGYTNLRQKQKLSKTTLLLLGFSAAVWTLVSIIVSALILIRIYGLGIH